MAINFLNVGSFPDDVKLTFGGATDYEIYHNSTTNVNHISSLLDRQLSVNANIIQLTNQANSTTYLKLESSEATFTTDVRLPNSGKLYTYTGNDHNYITYNSWYIWTGSDVIIRNASTGPFKFQTNGANDVLTLDSSQNATFAGTVGINIAAPTSTYQLRVDGHTLISAEKYYYVAGGGAGVGSDASGNLILRQNSADLMTTSGSDITFAGNVDVNGTEITVGTNGSIFAENNIRFKSSGAAYIDHNTTSQSIKFRLSNSSSLDVTPLEITPSYLVAAGSIFVGADSTYDLGATANRWANLWVDSINGATPAVGADYLPLAGGTMTGNAIFNDNVQIRFGTSGAESYIYSDGSDTYYQGNNGNLWFYQAADDKDIIFSCDDGSGGVTEYFKVDGSETNILFSKNARFIDSISAQFGTDGDLVIKHDGDSKIDNFAGDLYIRNHVDDKDIYFECDDGSGGMETYFFLDGSASGGDPYTVFPDSSNLSFGTGRDSTIQHNGSRFQINSNGGPMYITQSANDGDLILESDNGSGGTTTYLTIEGSDEQVQFSKDARLFDNIKARWGTSSDFQIWHDGSNTYLSNEGVGHLYIQNVADDKDIIFKSDDGSGGTTTYLTLDGSQTNIHCEVDFRIYDSKKLQLGNGADLEIQHDGTDSLVDNYTGHLYIRQQADDKSIYFQTDDGSGGVTTYMKVDGLSEYTQFDKPGRFMDSVQAQFGNSNDAGIYHNGTADGGTWYFITQTDNGYIDFRTDNGSGGTTSYLVMDGSNELNRFYKRIQLEDNVKATFGNISSPDLEIYHDGSHSRIDETGTGGLILRTGDFYLRNPADEEMIYATSGGAVNLYYDNSKKFETTTLGATIHGNLNLNDNGHLRFGADNDLDIYHSGTDSYITDSGTGDLFILGSEVVLGNGVKKGVRVVADGMVQLRHNDATKLWTEATGVQITGTLTTSAGITGTTLTLSGKGTSAATIAGDGSTTLTTKGYVDSLITGATLYQGTWDPDKALNSGYGNPDLSTGALQVNGYYYICSDNGIAEPNGTGTEPDSWHTGDWVIWNDDLGASGEWQKIDNTTVLSGAGTGEYLARWTDTETLGDSVVLTSGSDILIPQYIKHVGDTNTYFGFSGNDIIQFNTNGSERMRILSSGEVGIGTSTPQTTLQVDGVISVKTGDAYRMYNAAGTGWGEMNFNEVNNRVEFNRGINNSGADWLLSENSVDSYVCANEGAFGIGTTSPGNKLHIVSGDEDTLRLVATSGQPAIFWYPDGSVKWEERASASTWQLYSYDESEWVFNLYNGKCGIGTTTPAYKLDVYQAAASTVRFGSDDNSTVIINSNANDSATKEASIIYFQDGGATKWSIYKETSQDLYVYNPVQGKYPLHFKTGGDVVMMEDGNKLTIGSSASGATSRLIVNQEGGVEDGFTLQARTNRARLKVADNDTTGYVTAEAGIFGFGRTASVSANNINVDASHNVGIRTITPAANLDVQGGIIAGGKTTYTIAAGASLTTTGTAVAGLSTGTNLQSSGFIFTCFGGDGFQRIVYSCRNESGTWNIDKDIDEGVNAFDVTYAADGSDNITFTFKSRSGTQSYAPRVTVEAIGDQINQSYIN